MMAENWKRTFFIIWSGQAASLIGSSLVHFALVWWMTQTTGSAAVLATAALVGALPQVILGPFIGALVDRWDRQRVMIVADSTIAALTLVLVYLFWTGQIEIWHLYGMAFARGLGGTFHWSAMQASTSLMVPKEQLSRVAGLNQMLQGILSIATPPLGALLLEIIPMHSILAIDVGTAVIAVVPLLFVKIPQIERTAEEQRAALAVTPRSLLLDVRAALRYLSNWPGMLILLGMATMINFLLNPGGALLPLLVKDHFGGSAWHLGAMESAWSVGIIGGGLLLSAWGGFQRKIVTSMIGLIFMGMGPLMIGLAPGDLFWLAVGGQVVSGLFNPMVNGPLFAVLQERIAPEMQGRVFTLVSSMSGAMSPLGLALAAPVAEAFGVQSWFVIGGAACMLMGIVALMIPAVVGIESMPIPVRPAVEPMAASEPAVAD
jgi:DHA3 family macrolide efflux protein-like MFS transporter